MDNYIRLLLSRSKDRELILWLAEEKSIDETLGRAARRKLYQLMRKEQENDLQSVDSSRRDR